jgi:hypothetical protein
MRARKLLTNLGIRSRAEAISGRFQAINKAPASVATVADSALYDRSDITMRGHASDRRQTSKAKCGLQLLQLFTADWQFLLIARLGGGRTGTAAITAHVSPGRSRRQDRSPRGRVDAQRRVLYAGEHRAKLFAAADRSSRNPSAKFATAQMTALSVTSTTRAPNRAEPGAVLNQIGTTVVT